MPWNPTSVRRDITAGIVTIVTVPVMLAFIGLKVGDLAFAVPVLFMGYAAVRALSAAGQEAVPKAFWTALAAGSVLAGTSKLVLVGGSFLAGGGVELSEWLALLAGVAFVVGFAAGARSLRMPAHRALDALLAAVVLVGFWVLIVRELAPMGMTRLTLAASLAAAVGGAIWLIADPDSRHQRTAWPIAAGMVVVAVGDLLAYVPATAALATGVAALVYTVGFALISLGGEKATGPPADPELVEQKLGTGWLVSRVINPFLAALAFPVVALVQFLAGSLETSEGVMLFCFFSATLVIGFWRQAYVLIENRSIVAGERDMREEAERRSQELEALTGLAATMTQTLEEPPIVEQGLEAVQLAGRAKGSGLFLRHEHGSARPVLTAQGGTWERDEPWAMKVLRGADGLRAVRVGRRSIAYVPLRARERVLGCIILVRPEREAYDSEELRLLSLLGDELGVAIQNARDYREKLEQAIRDPLTNVYNHRFFHETLSKEMERAARYGSQVSLVLFDLDDFKEVNDREGHLTGDDVLREVAAAAEGIVRPSDSVARLGGEEFGILLPETDRMEAYMIAERIRSSVAAGQIAPGVRVTISAGISTCPGDATDLASLFGRADAALYWSKRNGKNLCSVSSEETERDRGERADKTVSVLNQLVAAIDARELNTRDHSENVATYAVAIGRFMGLDEERLSRLHTAAYLHDLGKVAISRQILVKPGPLSEDEWRVMERHPGVGAEIALHAGLVDEAVWIRHHHERYDGDGYPGRIVGEEVPLESRIIFVADSFEAMTSDRPYRRGMAVDRALDELRRCAGTQFDAQVVEALTRLIEEKEVRVVPLVGSNN